MIKSVAMAAALAVIAAGQPLHAQEITRLVPSSDWMLDPGEERCSLYRFFGAENQLALRIDSYGRFQEYRLTLWGSVVPRSPLPSGRLSFRLTSDDSPRELRGAQQGLMGELPARAFSLSFGPPADDMPATAGNVDTVEKRLARRSLIAAFQQQVENIEISFGNGATFDLRIGAMARPLQALELCTDELLRNWGADPDRQKSLHREPIVDPEARRKIARSYPRRMLVNGITAVIPVRVMVEVDGSASDCVIQTASIPQDFRDVICQNLADGFQPALDQNEQPVSAVFLTNVSYQIAAPH